ncbi:MAG: MBL fold metallo-hydrolase [Microthrixaceae bacterium]|nr:MBL fold metallo-hydrolase [Microthrixaceae bacterium]HRX18197.1 MBL fold metallo-hydrolase [Gemmatimonadales bacterium]
MRLTLLGTGTSMGVPQIGCGCATCRSEDPRDRRSRTAAVISSGETTLLIDTPPELRLQLLGAGIAAVDAVLYTHRHADHVHGIDDLRSVSLARGASLPLYGPRDTMEHLEHRFHYIFDERVVPVPGTSKPRLTTEAIAPDRPFRIGDLSVLPLAFEHGRETVFGYRVGQVAYVTDVKAVPAAAREALRGVEILVLNALWWREHPTHLSIPEAVETARAIGARRTILTHLTHETTHAELLARLPEGVEPGWDGMVVEV